MDKGQITAITAAGVRTDFIDIKNKQAIVDLIYPVGSLYFDIGGGVTPSEQFGGTWELIKTGKFIEATDTSPGTEVNPGLPNLTGTFSNNYNAITATMFVDVGTSGVFSKSGSRGYVNISSRNGTSGYPTNIDFNASNSNKIYGASSTVQPSSIKCKIWQRTA